MTLPCPMITHAWCNTCGIVLTDWRAPDVCCSQCHLILLTVHGTASAKENEPEIICFCGSSRFISEMSVMMWEAEKMGKIALGLHLVPMEYAKCEHHLAESQGVAEQMDALHLKKIDLADRVFIVNVGGYIGESTRREIAYARERGKNITWLEPENEGAER